jgi:hypothetical protein
VSILPLKTVSPPIYLTTGEEHRAVVTETSIVLDNEGSAGCRESHTKCSCEASFTRSGFRPAGRFRLSPK